MATNTIEIPAPAGAVFDVLMDARAYAKWVIGPRRVVSVSDDWPLPGSRFIHEESFGPLKVRDETDVLRVDRPRALTLQANMRPFGLIADIDITLEPSAAGGTRITMVEVPIGGLISKIWNPLFDAAMKVRNARSLQKLADLVLERSGAQPRSTPRSI